MQLCMREGTDAARHPDKRSSRNCRSAGVAGNAPRHRNRSGAAPISRSGSRLFVVKRRAGPRSMVAGGAGGPGRHTRRELVLIGPGASLIYLCLRGAGCPRNNTGLPVPRGGGVFFGLGLHNVRWCRRLIGLCRRQRRQHKRRSDNRRDGYAAQPSCLLRHGLLLLNAAPLY